jgi:hypothetical protein
LLTPILSPRSSDKPGTLIIIPPHKDDDVVCLPIGIVLKDATYIMR